MNIQDKRADTEALFTKLQSVLVGHLEDLKEEIFNAAVSGQADRHKPLADKARTLKECFDFFTESHGLYLSMEEDEDATEGAQEDVPPASDRVVTRAPHHKGKKTLLEVHFGGAVYADPIAKKTFVAVLQAIGLERIEALGVQLCGCPLVSRHASPVGARRYPDQVEVDGWHIITHSNTDTKRRLLEDIGARLRLTIKVRIVPASNVDFEAFLASF